MQVFTYKKILLNLVRGVLQQEKLNKDRKCKKRILILVENFKASTHTDEIAVKN